MKSKDISSEADIHQLVYTFYGKIRKNDVLSPVFNAVIETDEWDFHLSKMIRFWSTLLLYTRSYHGDPMSKHFALSLDEEHFLMWLSLFHETIDELFTGKVAEIAKRRANGISRIMASNLGISPDSKLFEKSI